MNTAPDLELNLEIISKQYRKGRPQKGFKLLSGLIDGGRNRKLSRLLRDHRHEPIETSEEVELRDQVDYLIGFYSLLTIAAIAGYVPPAFTPKLYSEIGRILSQTDVQEYFSRHYPLVLPQLLLKKVRDNEPIASEPDEKAYILFEKFLLLNNSLKDDDIEQFLWFLDDGITNGYSISDLWNSLKDKNKLKKKLQGDGSDVLNSALWGFIKYTQFLQSYKSLLEEADDKKLLQSAFWHYQSYWFSHMKRKLGDIVSKALVNIQESVRMNDDYNHLEGDSDSIIEDVSDFNVWKESASQLKKIEDAIAYLTNSRLGDPLIAYHKGRH